MNKYRNQNNIIHRHYSVFIVKFKEPLFGLRQFLATESPLKMMKNASYLQSHWKLFHGSGRGEGLSKNVGHHVWLTTKSLKKGMG